MKTVKGHVKSSVTITDVRSKVASKPKETVKTISVEIPPGYYVGSVSESAGLTLSLGYQAAKIEVGCTIPWPMKLGSLRDAKRGLIKTEKLISDTLALRAADLKDLLSSIVAENKKRF